MKKYLVVLSAFLAILAVACSTSNVQKTSSNVIPPPQPAVALSTGELQQGQSLYSLSCARCHDLPEPKKYSQERWTGDILPGTFAKAQLDTSQQRLVKGYIISQL